jgi:hypothetical protein
MTFELRAMSTNDLGDVRDVELVLAKNEGNETTYEFKMRVRVAVEDMLKDMHK